MESKSLDLTVKSKDLDSINLLPCPFLIMLNLP